MSDELNLTPLLIVLGGLLAIVLALVGGSELRKRSKRGAAARTSHARQAEWRAQLLGALVDSVGRDTGRSRRLDKLRGQLDWDSGRFSLVLDYLISKGLVTRTAWGEGSNEEYLRKAGEVLGGTRVKLTSAGLDEFDRAQNGPTEHLPHIDNRGGIIMVDSPHAAPVLVNYGINPEELTSWIQMYRSVLEHSTGLSSAELARAMDLLSDLRVAMEEGDQQKVTRLGRTLRAIAEGVTGNAAFAALVTAARHLGFG